MNTSIYIAPMRQSSEALKGEGAEVVTNIVEKCEDKTRRNVKTYQA